MFKGQDMMGLSSLWDRILRIRMFRGYGVLGLGGSRDRILRV